MVVDWAMSPSALQRVAIRETRRELVAEPDAHPPARNTSMARTATTGTRTRGRPTKNL